ncbi:aminotransferase class IV [Mangrovimonas sp. DI 80]|uniref:aminotransferase class IV n=1 Tax=Mangrovimonas sp. DI 80 TaxID=1779330 RepID=UPI00097656B0|nr:aminotransferase class IV [Mangrovimonas sp. DI 80]OMP29937.1 aminotransferase class IV [Mangrovimonas sp. DI 80]
MINLNGTLQEETQFNLSIKNRGYQFGDALFETFKVVHGKILFLEDHYFRLMASMRILRMEIPMEFTMEFLQEEVLKTVQANNLSNGTARVRFTVDRGEGGKYTPLHKNINYNVVAEPLLTPFYSIDRDKSYEVDLFKDYYVAPGLLSTLKTNNKVINVLGSIYAQENQLQNCLLMNTEKQVVEALNGNLFLVKGDKIKSPPLQDGCLKGVMRKQIIELLLNMGDYEFSEASISPFELQKADELFVTNVITGIQPITKYRKKTFGTTIASLLVEKLNVKIRLS